MVWINHTVGVNDNWCDRHTAILIEIGVTNNESERDRLLGMNNTEGS